MSAPRRAAVAATLRVLVTESERAVDVAVTVRLCLHREGVVLLERQVRVTVCEARHLHTIAWVRFQHARKQQSQVTDCHRADKIERGYPGRLAQESSQTHLSSVEALHCHGVSEPANATHLLLFEQVNLGRLRAEVAVRPQERLRAGVRVVAGHDGQLQAQPPPAARLRLGLQRQDVLDVQLRWGEGVRC